MLASPLREENTGVYVMSKNPANTSTFDSEELGE
jgi:hypothetical protein